MEYLVTTQEKFLGAWRPPIKILIMVSTNLTIGYLFLVGKDHLYSFSTRQQSTSTYFLIQLLGLTFKEKWNSDNILTAEMTIEDQVCCLHLVVCCA